MTRCHPGGREGICEEVGAAATGARTTLRAPSLVLHPAEGLLLKMLPLICLFGALVASSLAAPYNPHATVRVSFVSPPHSYSHGHDLMPAASEAHGAIQDESLLQVYPYTQSANFEDADVTEAPTVLEGPELEALIARFASNQPRFFDQFPHERSLLSNIELRLSQNLPALRTGSIRPGSPFYRI